MTCRRVFPLLLAVLLLAACSTGDDAVDRGGFQFVAPDGQKDITYQRSERQQLPPIDGERLMRPGEQISTKDYPGKVVVLNIWGSWCPPCRAEAPELEEIAEGMRDSGVRVLGIDVRDNRSAAQDFVRNYGVGYPSIYDPPGRSLLALKGYPRNTVPSTIVLDRQHRVAAVFLRSVLASDLRPVLRRVADESAHSGS